MSEAIRNRPPRHFVYTPLSKSARREKSLDQDKSDKDQATGEAGKGKEEGKATDQKEKEKGRRKEAAARPQSPYQESKDAYKKMKARVHAVYQRPFVMPRPAPLSYDERMKKEKLQEEKQKLDEERRKANKALMAKVDAIAARPTPVYRVKYIYS